MKTLVNACGVGIIVFTAVTGLLMQSSKAASTVLPIALIILIAVGLATFNRPVKPAPVKKLDDMLDQADKMKGDLRK